MSEEVSSPSSSADVGRKVDRKYSAMVEKSQLPKPIGKKVFGFTWSEIEVKQVVGSGGNCVVHRALMDGEEYALKQVDPKYLSGLDSKQYKTAVFSLLVENHLLGHLQHDHIVELYGIQKGSIPQAVSNGTFFLLEELLGDTLDNRLDDWLEEESSHGNFFGKGGKAAKARLCDRLEMVGMGVARAMQELHSKNIVFRDLKPAKVGFDKDGKAKLFGFGTATEMHPQSSSRLELAGTLRYMAPEVLAGRWYGKEVDVYSFGLFLWEISTLQKPFYQWTRLEQFQEAVVRDRKRPPLSALPWNGIKSLIQQCWDADPARRPEFPKITKELALLIADLKKKIGPRRASLNNSSSHSSGSNKESSKDSNSNHNNSNNKRGGGVMRKLKLGGLGGSNKKQSNNNNNNNDGGGETFADLMMSELTMTDQQLKQIAQTRGGDSSRRFSSDISSRPSIISKSSFGSVGSSD